MDRQGCGAIKLFSILLAFEFLILTLIGCETLKETGKGFWGVSTRSIENARKDAITKSFNYDYATCYEKAKAILKSMQTYTYAQSKKKNMIAVYISEEDTTPVGIFFKEIDASNTQVEVSSQSTYAKEYMSKEIFSVLDNKSTLEELEARINAKIAKEAAEKMESD